MLAQQMMMATIYTLIVMLGTIVVAFGVIICIGGNALGAVVAGAPIYAVAHFSKVF